MNAPPLTPQARALHESALVWDNHGCLPFIGTERWLAQLWRYREAGTDLISINLGDGAEPLETLIRTAAIVRSFVRRNPDRYLLANSADAIERAHASQRLAIALDVEGGAGLGEELSLLELLYDLGVRWMSLVYNRRNLLGSGCHDDPDGGLTPLGHAAVREMDRIGMVKCCSHAGYRTAMDVLTGTDVPTIFSHSNPRALRNHPRNITDDLLKACAATGGVVCLSGIGILLGDNDASATRFVDHIDYLVDRIGPEHVGIGLDYVFDQEGMNRLLAQHAEIWPAGFGYRPGIRMLAPEGLPLVTEEMLRRGHDEHSVRKVLGANLLRLAREVWQ